MTRHTKITIKTSATYPSYRRGLAVAFFLFSFSAISSARSAMTVSGPITANNVTVTGDVTMSSVTVSTLTVAGVLTVNGNFSELVGRVLQMQLSSTTVGTTFTSVSSFTAAPDLRQSISLSSASNSVCISLGGSFSALGLGGKGGIAYLSIFRDSLNLGDPTTGLAAVSGAGAIPGFSGSGVTIVDAPGDEVSHTYQVFVKTGSGISAVFPSESAGFLLLEEIGQ